MNKEEREQQTIITVQATGNCEIEVTEEGYLNSVQTR